MQSTPDLVTPRCAAWVLEDVVERLKAKTDVEAVVLLGSAAADLLTETSDYDLMIVLAEHDSGFSVEVSIVDGRLTDLLIVSSARLRSLTSKEEDRNIARWVSEGRVLFDRRGTVSTFKSDHHILMPPVDESLKAASWVNYDLLVNRSYARSIDPVVRLALELRSMHVFFRTFMAWFTVRGLPWEGEKKAIKTLQQSDPQFLDLVMRWLAEHDVSKRASVELEAARAALEPVGGVWPAGQVDPGAGVWERLMAPSPKDQR